VNIGGRKLTHVGPSPATRTARWRKTHGVFSADRGMAVRGTFLVDRDGIVRFAEVNAPGEPRDQDAWKKALASVA
jgi:alkyl hydroperoxide reductase subunit AhpC